MSESNLLENAANTAVDEAPQPFDRKNLTEKQRKIFDRVKQEVTDFRPPQGFLFVLPNVMRGISTKFERATDDPTLTAESKTDEIREIEKAAEELIKTYQSEYAIFFSAKEVPIGGKSAETLNNWHPLHVPSMIGRAKLVMIHVNSWNLLANYSIVVRWHQSLMEPLESEVYEIYALPPQVSVQSFVSDVACISCKKKPAPIKCVVCESNFCSATCKDKNKVAHEEECLTIQMQRMQLTIATERMSINENRKAFEAEQKIFEERNRGKVVTVRHVDKDGKVLSETQEIVVPASDAAV